MTNLYCRLCAKLTAANDLIDIIDNENELRSKLLYCFQIEITINDSLPKQSCYDCKTKVHDFYNFYLQLKKAQEILLKIEHFVCENSSENSSDKVFPKSEINSDNEHGIKINNVLVKTEELNTIIESEEYPVKKPRLYIKRSTKRKITEETAEEIEEIKQKFYQKMNSTGLKDNIHIISDESYIRYIRELEEASGPKPKKMPVDYRRIAKFELYTENGVKRLIVPRPKLNSRIKYYLPKSELFEHIRNAHLESNHGGRTRTETVVKSKYKNITRKLISLYITLCKVCGNRRKIVKDEVSVLKRESVKKIAEPLTVAGYEWKCKECNDIVQSARELEDHYESIHKKPVEYVCIECSKVYNSYVPFRNHLLRHRNKFRYKCEICSNYFSSSRKLRNHLELHNTNRKKYFCSKCGKGFFCENSIARHERIKHSGIVQEPKVIMKTHECDVCHKMFASVSVLNYHKKIHSGIREHTCEHCGKSFVRKQYLEEHITLHSDERPYKCELCPASFKVKVCLKRHLFLHTGIKPFQCDICGKKFPRKPALQEHSIKHTDSYPFKCEACNKGFRFKRNLIRHTRLHTGEKPYSCSICNRHFTCMSNYDRHMKRHHGVVKIKKELNILNKNVQIYT